MGCDLEIDTDLIRHAAAVLAQAGDALAAPAAPAAATVGEHALGPSAEGRQARRLAVTRAQQAAQAAGDLRDLAGGLADRLAGVATSFEQAEAWCGAGG